MKNRKSTYLVKSAPKSGATMEEITGKQWFEIVRANKDLPASQRRYFIVDKITDDGFEDRIVMEVSEQEYTRWKVEQQARRRNLNEAAEYTFLSLEDLAPEGTVIAETLEDTVDAIGTCATKILLQELKISLSEWNCWGVELLAMYLNGKRRASTAWLASKCGISEKQARIYRKRFEAYIKNFLS